MPWSYFGVPPLMQIVMGEFEVNMESLFESIWGGGSFEKCVSSEFACAVNERLANNRPGLPQCPGSKKYNAV